MENKPQNVLEMLDNQGEKVEDISKKLEGISINDLYALAKRTWDYGDYQTAQKYFNHISFLRPLDWEAPLYASLCNFKGYHNMFFFTKVPEQVEKIIISTIKYINNLDFENVKKESEMLRCLEIVKNYMIQTKEHYFKYKEDYDNVDSNYIYTLENYFLNVFNQVKDIEMTSIKSFIAALADELLDIIDKTLKVSSSISKDTYDELTRTSLKKYEFDFEKISRTSQQEIITPTNKLSLAEIKEIKLKGTMYFEYNDKFISKKLFNQKLFIGSSLIILSIVGIIFSLLSNWLYALLFALPFLYGMFLNIAAITQKNIINCSSILCSNRIKNRLTSDGNIVKEKKINPLIILFLIGRTLLLFATIYVIIIGIFYKSEIKLLYRTTIFMCGALSVLIYYYASLKFSVEYYSKYDRKYFYSYKGKKYKLD